jgi:hypothetical protein
MRQKTIEVTKEAFNNLYGNAYLKGKYGDDWVDIVINDLKKEGTIVKFVSEKQVQAKKELQSINKINL